MKSILNKKDTTKILTLYFLLLNQCDKRYLSRMSLWKFQKTNGKDLIKIFKHYFFLKE